MPPQDQTPLPEDVTRILREACGGDRSRWNDVLEALYGRLREIAQREIRDRPGDHTIETTALADEAWAKLAGRTGAVWQDRGHFLAVAAIAMRGILVDEARARRARKRGGDSDRLTLTSGLEQAASDRDPVGILDLHEALGQLTTFDARQGRIVEMKFFGGMTIEEMAVTLGVSTTTVEGEWRLARAWLGRRLEENTRA